jgi:hypothetical protein
MPLAIKRKGIEQKQKQKQKQFGDLFFGLDVFFGVAIYFYLSSKIGLFLSIFWPMAADPDRSQRMLCPGPD